MHALCPISGCDIHSAQNFILLFNCMSVCTCKRDMYVRVQGQLVGVSSLISVYVWHLCTTLSP